MKYFLVLIIFASLLFGVQPVPRNNGDKDEEKKTEKVIKTTNKTEKKDTKQKDKDKFIDNNANGVNDQREEDLQKIKQLNSKHKDLLKENNNKKSKEVTPPTKKKTTKKSSGK
ncbi:MAG: hypothetical protein WBB37_07235 [bacterium]